MASASVNGCSTRSGHRLTSSCSPAAMNSDTLVRCDSFGAFYVPKNQDTWDTIKSIMGEILDIDDATLEAAGSPQRTTSAATAAPMVREKRNKVLIVEDDADLAARARAAAEEVRRRDAHRLERH